MHRNEIIDNCIGIVNQIEDQVEKRNGRMGAESPIDYAERTRTTVAHVVSVYCASVQAQATYDANYGGIGGQ